MVLKQDTDEEAIYYNEVYLKDKSCQKLSKTNQIWIQTVETYILFTINIAKPIRVNCVSIVRWKMDFKALPGVSD